MEKPSIAELSDRTWDVLIERYSVDPEVLHQHEVGLLGSAIKYAHSVAGNEFDAASKFMASLVERVQLGLMSEDASIDAAPGTAISLHRKMNRIDLFDQYWLTALGAGRSISSPTEVGRVDA